MKRGENHTVGDVGETSAGLEFKRWGWTADKIPSDYGEDLDCTIFVNSLKTQYHFRCQVKSTIKNGKYIRKLKDGNFSVRINMRVAKSWLLSYYPVLLIIYDESIGNHFWINASSYLKNNLSKFGKKSITIRIASSNVLKYAKVLILEEIKRFYDNFFRIDSSVLSCNIYPIFMPKYLTMGLDQYRDIPKTDLFKLEFDPINIEDLPSWFVDFENLHPRSVISFKVSSSGYNLEDYIDKLMELLLTWKFSVKEGEWISFIIGPIQSETQNNNKNEIWNRKHIDWFVLSSINGKIYFDERYAFELPHGFLRQIARKAMSYEYFHHINPEDDVALELFSSIKTPKSFISESNSYYKQIKAQFIPWRINANEETLLYTQLPEGYSFTKVSELMEIPQKIRGFISKEMFNPTIGIFNRLTRWEDLNENSVEETIKKLSNNNEIVGNEDNQDISKLIFDCFENIITTVELTSITEMDTIPGYPLDLSKRMIFVQRYRKSNSPNLKLISNVLEEYKEKLKEFNLNELCADYQEVDLYDGIPIYRIFFHWNPNYKNSSLNSYDQVGKLIIECFDKIFPQNLEKNNNTYNILRFVGQLYFEEFNQ